MQKGEEGFCNYLYQGQTLDVETGLAYNRFRYYGTEEGTYISRDPITILGNNPNLYAYVKDQCSWVDVYGLNCASVNANGELEIKDKFPAGSIESLELRDFADKWNTEITNNGGSMTRKAISKQERRAASKAAKKFRDANPHLFQNGEVAGHIPDAGWGGNANGPFTPLTSDVNSYVGGATQAVPVGTSYTSVKIVP